MSHFLIEVVQVLMSLHESSQVYLEMSVNANLLKFLYLK